VGGVLLMVMSQVWLSPACSARATARRAQRRTADLFPDWLEFPNVADATRRGHPGLRLRGSAVSRSINGCRSPDRCRQR
jgi:hypothetical protein